MKNTITLSNDNHTAIRIALMQSIREFYKIRRFSPMCRSAVKDAVSTLRLVRNSSVLESTPYSFPK